MSLNQLADSLKPNSHSSSLKVPAEISQKSKANSGQWLKDKLTAYESRDQTKMKLFSGSKHLQKPSILAANGKTSLSKSNQSNGLIHNQIQIMTIEKKSRAIELWDVVRAYLPVMREFKK